VSDRKLRRAASHSIRKARRKMLAHDCVLDRAARDIAEAVQIEAGAEQHRLHVAMGEDWCTACQVCSDMRARGRQATLMNEREVSALLELWRHRVDQARGGQEAAARQAARAELERAVFGG
jgi:hypothetical protein